MRAVVCEGGRLDVASVADPVPGKGQVVLEVEACGICGSDLHARTHCDDLADDAAATGYDDFMRSDQSVVMGHEFSGRVVDAPRGARFKDGTPLVSMPLRRDAGVVQLTGLSLRAPGGYAERVLVDEALSFEVPNGLSLTTASLTEPMAVALHAVRRGEVGKKTPAIVIGCGPIGLGVIAMLKARGVRHVIASDFSPGRRALAERMGADVVIDPAEVSPFDDIPGALRAPDLLEMAAGSMEKLRAVPFLPWQHVFRLAEVAGQMPSGPVVFECVGVPGVLQQVLEGAPLATRVVVVGVCMELDRIRPALAINKEIDLRFVLGYTPGEFHQTLHLIADGSVDPTPLITGQVGLDGVAGAFDALGDPERHAKIQVLPGSEALLPG